MWKRLTFSFVIVSISLVFHSASMAAVIPPPPKTLTLRWNYPQISPDIVFNVYSSPNLSVPVKKWPVYTNVTTTSCVVRVAPGSQFFTVTASNKVSRLESAYSR
jgi:hypothetical protein